MGCDVANLKIAFDFQLLNFEKIGATFVQWPTVNEVKELLTVPGYS